jgi:hypothetical protein
MITAIVSAYYAKDFIVSRINNLLELECEIVVVCQEFSIEHTLAYGMGIRNIVLTRDIPTVYRAWNLGLKQVTTPYVTNANSDDILYPGVLQYLVRLLEHNPEYCLAYGNSDIVKQYGGFPVNRYEWLEGGLPELLAMCFIGPMPVWRRSLHEKYGFFDEEMRSAGDYEFWLRLASSGEKFLHTKRCVGAFLSHRQSASMREPLRSTWETARARSRYKHLIKE